MYLVAILYTTTIWQPGLGTPKLNLNKFRLEINLTMGNQIEDLLESANKKSV